MSPLVSIIIPTYGRPDKLVKAVNSVSQQTYPNWELLIVDDNPPGSHDRDRTRQAVANLKLSNPTHYIEQRQNSGACKARNTGAQAANGEYIAFLDDDDIWFPEKLTKQIEKLEAEVSDINYCDMYLSYHGGRKYFAHRLLPHPYEALLERGFGICTSAVLIKSEVFKEVGGFDVSLTSMQDYDLLLRVAKNHKMSHTQEALLIYQLGDDGITQNPKAKLDGHLRILNKYYDDFKTMRLDSGLSRQFESIADFASRTGSRMEALRYYGSAAKHGLSGRLLIKCVGCLLSGGWLLEQYLKHRLRRSLEKN